MNNLHCCGCNCSCCSSYLGTAALVRSTGGSPAPSWCTWRCSGQWAGSPDHSWNAGCCPAWSRSDCARCHFQGCEGGCSRPLGERRSIKVGVCKVAQQWEKQQKTNNDADGFRRRLRDKGGFFAARKHRILICTRLPRLGEGCWALLQARQCNRFLREMAGEQSWLRGNEWASVGRGKNKRTTPHWTRKHKFARERRKKKQEWLMCSDLLFFEFMGQNFD